MYRAIAVKALVVVLSTIGMGAQAAEPPPIRVGEISSYSALPVGTRGYRQGWELAQDQINAKGGVLGRRLEIIARDEPASRTWRSRRPPNWSNRNASIS
jgi:branched-chain amino acid transport system substrate-binding protein